MSTKDNEDETMIFSNETTDAVATLGGSGFTKAGGTVLTSLGKVMGTAKERRSGYLSGKSKHSGVRKDKGNKEETTVLSNVNSTGSNDTPLQEMTAWDYDSDSSTTGTVRGRNPNLTSKSGPADDTKMNDLTDTVFDPMRNEIPWTTVQKKRQNTMIYATETEDERVQETPKEVMKRRGDAVVEASTDKETPVSVEFKIPKTTTKFNLREAVGKLLTMMLKVDQSVKFGASGGEEVWNDPHDLPVGDALTTQLRVRQDSPPYETPKVTMYLTIRSTKTVNDIKYQPLVIAYLKASNIFLRPDRYNSSKTRSPGYFFQVSPRLLWKQTFIEDIKKGVHETKFDTNEDLFTNYF